MSAYSEHEPWGLGGGRVASRDLTVGVISLSQTVVGILGNFLFLYQNVTTHLRGHKLKPLDFTLRHLIFANILALLSKGLPQMVAAFGLRHFLGDSGCKLIFYVHRVAAGVSFSTTCLLSVLQAIMISPRNSTWTSLKGKAPKYAGFTLYLCWILHLLVNTFVFTYVSGKWSSMNTTKQKDVGYCSITHLDTITSTLLAAFLSPPSTLSFGLMTLASGYMVFTLYRHHQQVRHIPRNNRSARSLPEIRAAQRILALVSTFLSFYMLCTIFVTFMLVFNHPSWWLINISSLTRSCFPTISPFLLMSPDTCVSRLCSACCRRNNPVPKRVRKL